jgi:hypothetical protein
MKRSHYLSKERALPHDATKCIYLTREQMQLLCKDSVDAKVANIINSKSFWRGAPTTHSVGYAYKSLGSTSS